MRYIALGRPPALPNTVLSSFPSHQRPSLSKTQDLTGEFRPHATDDGTVLLVRRPTPKQDPDSQRSVGGAACLLHDEPSRIYIPVFIRPWVMQACHSTASCHLGTTCTLRMVERFYWWICMSICTRWWDRHCLKCQAWITSRRTLRWPVISIPLVEGPGIAVSVDYVGHLPVTPRGNTHILLVTDRFSHRATFTWSLQPNVQSRVRLIFL